MKYAGALFPNVLRPSKASPFGGGAQCAHWAERVPQSVFHTWYPLSHGLAAVPAPPKGEPLRRSRLTLPPGGRCPRRGRMRNGVQSVDRIATVNTQCRLTRNLCHPERSRRVCALMVSFAVDLVPRFLDSLALARNDSILPFTELLCKPSDVAVPHPTSLSLGHLPPGGRFCTARYPYAFTVRLSPPELTYPYTY